MFGCNAELEGLEAMPLMDIAGAVPTFSVENHRPGGFLFPH